MADRAWQFGTLKGLQNLALLSAPGRWLFERSDEWSSSAGLTLHWYPGARIRLWALLTHNRLERTGREVVELDAGGKLAVVDWPLPEDRFSRNGVGYGGGLQFVFSSISQLRFQYVHGEGQELRFLPSGPVFAPFPKGDMYLTLSWWLDGAKKR